MAQPIVGWFEITGKDGPALPRFYSKLFGWSIHDAGDGSGYGLVEAPRERNRRRDRRQPGPRTGRVTFYAEVDDPAAFLDRAEKRGTPVVPPIEIPGFGLTFAFFADPEGHVVALSRGALQ